ncbi:OLC1v1023022C1 [Oldenlandia corymbosa var. corymbosa]|uniref:OLC1v1023022C1 n=1 Tax=Oldenlandia corymbosa var. corymbosa TaxID=529605 RepID=A0AAV1BZ24_OLDCO|nr:OLC1v1023022C1 [Oldenlandia corymbosa var. corymbosa]
MKFLLEMVACCGSCSGNSMVKEEASLLVPGSAPPSPTPRAGRPKGRKRWRSGGANGGGSAVDWRPSLTSICEENVLSERTNKDHPPRKDDAAVVKTSPSSPSDRNLKRKITSTPRTRSSSSSSYSSREDVRHSISIHAVMPTFSPAPFMF